MELLIDKNIFTTKVALVKNNELFNFKFVFNNEKNIIGNIYLGRVVNIMPKMKAVFIDLGFGNNAYLDYADLLNDIEDKNNKKNYYPGKEILVQVTKNSNEQKGPKVSEKISISSKNLVLLFNDSKIYISKKIQDEELRTEFREYFKDKIHKFGLIMRTESAKVSIEDLTQELNSLINIHHEINKSKILISKERLVYEEVNEYLGWLYNYNEINKIVTNDLKIYEKIKHINNIPDSIFKEKLDLSNYSKNLELNKVSLEGGINIVIDHTEALTVIDVNSGKNKAGLFETNLKALKEIARQVNIRNISGIIIIDAINIEDKTQRKVLVNAFIRELGNYKSKVSVFGFTKTGLIEMTKKYDDISIDDKIYLNNELKVEYLADELVSKLKYILLETNSDKLLIKTRKDVIEFLKSKDIFQKFIIKNELTIEYQIASDNTIKHLF